jgi:hypothetical protein
MNLNQLAKEICKREGKKKQVDIAQVKEVLGVLIEILSESCEIGYQQVNFTEKSQKHWQPIYDAIEKQVIKNQKKKAKKK